MENKIREDLKSYVSCCEIELIKYKDSFKQDEKAVVGTHRLI